MYMYICVHEAYEPFKNTVPYKPEKESRETWVCLAEALADRRSQTARLRPCQLHQSFLGCLGLEVKSLGLRV